MIPIAVAVLAPAVFLVAGPVARNGRTPQQMDLSTSQTRAAAPTAEPAPRDTPEAAPRAAAESSSDTAPIAGQDASDSETDVTVLSSAESAESDEAESPAACQRILALREQFEMQGVNPARGLSRHARHPEGRERHGGRVGCRPRGAHQWRTSSPATPTPVTSSPPVERWSQPADLPPSFCSGDSTLGSFDRGRRH